MKYLIGFRKFTMGATFLLVTLILLLNDVVSSGDFMKHNKEVIVAFMATNIGEHLINIGKKYIDDKLLSTAKNIGISKK